MQRLIDVIRDGFHRPKTTTYGVFTWVVTTLIVLSIAVFFADLATARSGRSDQLWRRVDLVILALFALEIVLRVGTFHPPELDFYKQDTRRRLRTQILGRVRYCLRPLVLVDLLAVVAVVPALRGLRALRLLRLFRGVRIFRYHNPIKGLVRAFQDNQILFTFAFTLLGGTTLLGGLTIFLIESRDNPDVSSIGDGIWWALVTLTTVGFGDIAPVSVLGRVVGGALMILGMFTLALFAGIIGRTLVLAVWSFNEEQFRMSTHLNHVVVCGYDAGARMLLDALLQEFDPEASELLIFEDGDRPEELPDAFIWVDGDPNKESELDKARLAYARAAIIVGSRAVPPQQADAITLLRIFTIRSHLKRAEAIISRKRPLYIVAEILDVENVDHARKAGANEVIESTRVGFSLLAHAAAVPGTARVLASVAAAGAHSVFLGCLPPEYEAPVEFGPLVSRLKRERAILVIGIQDPQTGSHRLNPSDATPITHDTNLIYLAKSEVLSRKTSTESHQSTATLRP